MREQRGKRAAASFLFKLTESVGTQGISFVVSVVLARLLDPSDYGVLTMLTVFIAVSQVFVQSGLNTALIQKKEKEYRRGAGDWQIDPVAASSCRHCFAK